MKKNRMILLFLALCMLATLAGCREQVQDAPADGAPAVEVPEMPEEPAIEEDYEDDDAATVILDEDEITEEEPVIDEAEAVSCVFPSVEAMMEAVEAEQHAFWKDQIALNNRLTEIDAVYVIAQDRESFELHSVEVTPNYIFLYYGSQDPESGMVVGPEDMIVTTHRGRDTTMESVCAEHGISPDGDGFAYCEEHGVLYYEQDGTILSVSAPAGRNDYDSLRALCELERVEIEQDDPSWTEIYEEYGDSAIYVEALGGNGDHFRAFEQTVSALGLSFGDAARQYCTVLTEVGDGAGWTSANCVKQEDGSYLMEVARLRSSCYDSGLPTLAAQVASQYEYFLNDKGDVLGPGRTRADADDLIFQLTGLTVFHPAGSGAKLHVIVNGTDCGDFELSSDSGCTLIPLELPEYVADKPVRVELRLVDAPESTEIDVYAGLSSNVSRSI